MITQLTPLEETRAYQQIFSKGKAEGEAEGEAKTLLWLLRQRFGAVPDWAEQRALRRPPSSSSMPGSTASRRPRVSSVSSDRRIGPNVCGG